MKTANYKRLAMTISLTNSRGRYLLTATVNGKQVTATTDDAEIYDYFDCDYYDQKDKNWARRAAYNVLMANVCEVIAYKQGDNWVCNINGVLTTLHYSIKTKSSVRKHFAEIGNDTNTFYKVTFD